MYLIYRGPPESPWETMIKRMDLIKRTKTIIKTISHLQTVQKNTYPYCYGADTALSNLSNLSTQIWFSTPSFRVFETQTTVIYGKTQTKLTPQESLPTSPPAQIWSSRGTKSNNLAPHCRLSSTGMANFCWIEEATFCFTPENSWSNGSPCVCVS